ncbi:MAG: choice-of-anchor Q domain-containing protein, partial [Dokdonella sp.]|uniref:DUF7452 domain-containing protein n=1 Tax=Dokdonella sp. TaxID=2291710 RepID=UPI003266BE11
MPRSIVRPSLAVLAFALAGVAHATTYTWPGAAPCDVTLQACVNGTTNGDRIEIASATINEDVSLFDADRTLTPAAGFHPAFGPGHSLSITSSAVSGDRTVAVNGLSFNDGYVFFNYRGVGTAHVDLRNLTLTRNVLTTSNYILVTAEHGTVNATVYNNRIVGFPPGDFKGMITLAAHGGTLNGDAYFNHVECVNGTLTPGAGILADYAGTGSGGTARIFGNEVRGSFGFGSIVGSEGLGDSNGISFNARAYSNVVVGTGALDSNGIRYLVNAGTISAQTVQNTVTRVDTGLSAGPYSGAPAPSRITGLMSSNLVQAVAGLYIDPAHAPAMTNDYNLINATYYPTALGAHSITADARVVSAAYPRLSADSPAIDSADATTVGFGIIFNMLPVLDADGLRRAKGASSAVDIGAYEYGDFTFEHTATSANTDGQITDFANPAGASPTAKLIATSNFNVGLDGGVLYSAPYGVYFDTSRWALFSQDISDMPIGAHFDV